MIKVSPVAAVETWNLSKTYKTGFWLNQKVTSLQNCTISIAAGETFGMLGPNGAGKTTLLKILLGITRPSGGKALLLGCPLGNQMVRQYIGYLPENAYFYEYLTAWEFLKFTGALFNMPSNLTEKRIKELLNIVGIAQSTAQKKRMKYYSKGMLQRVGLAQSLINDPELIFLDEPMSGLDPLGRYQVREIILSLKQQGKTIFFNSHVLADVEQICDRLAILAGGEILCSGSLQELLGHSDVHQVVVEIAEPEFLKPWLSNINQESGYWHGQLEGNLQEFITALGNMEARLISLNQTNRETLEKFFITQLKQRNSGALIQ